MYISRAKIPFDNNFPYKTQVCVYGFTKEDLKWFGATRMGPVEKAEGIELLRFLEHGEAVKMIAVPGSRLSIDTYEDLERVRSIMAGKFK